MFKTVQPALDKKELLNDRLFYLIEDLEEEIENVEKRKSAIISVALFGRNNNLNEDQWEKLYNLMGSLWNADNDKKSAYYTASFEKLKKEIKEGD